MTRLFQLSPIEFGDHLFQLAVATLGGGRSYWSDTQLILEDPEAVIHRLEAAIPEVYPAEVGWPWTPVGRGKLALGYDHACRAIAGIGSAAARRELVGTISKTPTILETLRYPWAEAGRWSLGLIYVSTLEYPVSAWVAVLLGRMAARYPDLSALAFSPMRYWRRWLPHHVSQNGMICLPTWNESRNADEIGALLTDVLAWTADDVSGWPYLRRGEIRGGGIPTYSDIAMLL